MITAVDTSVLIDVFAADRQFAQVSKLALREAVLAGEVVASEVVWTETAAGLADPVDLRAAMDRMGVRFDALTRESAGVASAAWRRYRSEAGPRTRVVPDFLIGAHALVQADRLLTRDRGFFRRYFRDLAVIDPTRSTS